MIAAITAGGRAEEAFARELGVAVKALALIDGVTMLDRAIDAAREAGAERVVVIGGDEVGRYGATRADAVIAESSDGGENVRRAIAAGIDRPLLLMSSDLPFVTGAAVADFVRRAAAHDVALPLAEAADYERTYPGAPLHVTRIGRERIANGSVVYFGPGVAPRALDVAQRLFDARKSLARMAALLGPGLLARFVLGRLRIADVERRGSALLGRDVRAIRNASPSLCFDIDTRDDLAYARNYANR